MDKKVRVRFAPSPTGPLHIGGVRTALYNYLFAKKHGGDFLLRIEDTDQSRYVENAEDYIVNALEWCGIIPDEGPGFGGQYGPYRQSERKKAYVQYAEQLVEAGKAYYAFDTPAELDEMRERLKKAKVASPQYNSITRESMRNSLTMAQGEVEELMAAGQPYVVRFKMPRSEEVRVNDLVRGWVLVNTNQLDDKVLFKSDGMPTYHLANIVDDHLMRITHVIRGEEWLPSAPLHILLYEAFGWEAPQFAHLPLLLKPDGNGKLSKRDGDRLGFPVFPLEWKDPITQEISSGYRERGYFPEAFINMLAFLGWNPGTTDEIFSMDQLIQAFSIDRVGKSGAKFDPEKAVWYNQHYLRMMPEEAIVPLLLPYLNQKDAERPPEFLQGVCRLMKERASFIPDIVEEGAYFFQAPLSYDEKTVLKKWKEDTPNRMLLLMAEFEKADDFNAIELEETFKQVLTRENLSMGEVLPNLRLLITGQGSGPGIFDVMALLGKVECLDRMSAGIKQLQHAQN